MDAAKAAAKAVAAMTPLVRRATVYLNEKQVVSVCRRLKFSLRNTREDFVLKIGAPNYLQRKFIACCKKAGEPLPIRKVQLNFWPVKR